MVLVIEFWRRHRLRIVLLLLLTLLGAASSVAGPRIIGFVVDAIQQGLREPATFNPRRLLDYALILIAIELVRSIVMVMLPFSRGMTNELFRWETLVQVYRRILHKSHRFTNTYPSGDVIERLDQDLDHLSYFACSALFMPIQALLTLIAALVILLRMNWLLTVITVVPLSITIIIWLRLGPLVRRYWQELRERISDTYRFLESSYSGIGLIKAYTMEERSGKTFRRLLSERIVTAIRALRVQTLIMTLMREGVVQFAILLILTAGGMLVIHQRLTLGELVAFNAYVTMLIFPTMMISMFFINRKQAEVEESRIRTMRDFPDEIDTKRGRKPAPRGAEIRLENVSFHYTPTGSGPLSPDTHPTPSPGASRAALRNINLVIPPGSRIGIAGTVGSGKTTLMRLLLRVSEPTAGAITIGGRPLAEFDITSLHQLFGLAPQEANLFSDTILENIVLGRALSTTGDSTRHSAEVLSRAAEVARIAQLESELKAMPNGLQEMIGERGLRLSGGQRARVSIARALFGKPPILLLDDVTANLDAETEQQFIRDVLDYMRGATLVIVSHRLAILSTCDIIYVFDEGQIVESGNHVELLNRRGTYWRLYQRQLVREALQQNGVD